MSSHLNHIMESRLLLSVLAWCWVLACVEASKIATLIDDKPIEDIAGEVCELEDGFERQIGRISTVQNLMNYLDDLEPEHRLAECQTRYLESIELLNDVVSREVQLCSPDKIAAIEQYHRDYVSTASKFKAIRKRRGVEAPHLIKVFFMQYASRVSTICSNMALGLLKMASQQPEEDNELLKLKAHIGGLDQGLESLDSYDNIFLMWNLMSSLPPNIAGSMNRYIELSKDTKMSVEVEDSEKFEKLQAACKQVAKPFYNLLILPVIRLVDLGYYPDNTGLLEQLRGDEYSRDLYALTMLCENLLPVRFLHNQSLAPGKMLIVEPIATPEDQLAGTRETGMELNLMATEQLEDQVVEEAAYELAKSIKSRVKSRGKVMKKVLKKILRNIRKRRPGGLEECDVMVRDELSETNEPVSVYLSEVEEQQLAELDEEELAGEPVAPSVSATRRKRHLTVTNFLRASRDALRYVWFVLVYYVLLWFPSRILMPAFGITIEAIQYAFTRLRRLF